MNPVFQELPLELVSFLASLAADAATGAARAVWGALARRGADLFARVWEDACRRLDTPFELQREKLRQLNDAFAREQIRNVHDLAGFLANAGVIAKERIPALVRDLIPALYEACVDLAMSDEPGAEQAARIALLQYHRRQCDDHQQHTEMLRRIEQILREAGEIEPLCPHMAPRPTEDFVERPQEKQRLLDALIEQRDKPVAITAVLEGAGGYGKTELARALCHSEEIADAFPGGNLWVTVGQNPGDLTTHLNDLLKHLGESREFDKMDAAPARLRELLADRQILIVIDDLWNRAHLDPFLQGGPQCAHLITTRIPSAIPRNAISVPVDRMLPAEATQLLATGLPNVSNDVLDTLANRLGHWALLLEIVNAALRHHVHGLSQPIAAAIQHVHTALDAHGLPAFDPDDPQERNQAVTATVRAGTDVLDTEEKLRFAELAIFPEDEDIPLTAVARLWTITGNFDESDTEELCVRLHDLSLLDHFNLGSRTLRLHDVMRDLLAGDLGARLQGKHAALLASYVLPHWSHLPPDDRYAWNHLAYHLAGAGRHNDLEALLLDPQWMDARIKATDVVGLLSDYACAPPNEDLHVVEQALRWSAHILAEHKDQLPEQLLARLDPAGSDRLGRLLGDLAQLKSAAWLHPQTRSLRPHPALLRTLVGHHGLVEAVAVTPDGRHAVSASSDRTLKVLWDLQSGEQCMTLEGHDSRVEAVAGTTDGGEAARWRYRRAEVCQWLDEQKRLDI